MVGAHGRTGGSAGGSCRIGHEQGLSSGPVTPEFVHVEAANVDCTPQLPTTGKSVGIRPKSIQASREMKG